MVKLTAVERQESTQLLLRFSDGAWGIYDFASFVEAGTEMTVPPRDPDFFAQCFIEMGALAWPNGFDLSAESHIRPGRARGGGCRAAAACSR